MIKRVSETPRTSEWAGLPWLAKWQAESGCGMGLI